MAIIKIKNPAIDLDAAEIPNLPATKITSGTFDNARISLDAAEIPNLDTAKITTGTLADARVPDLNASKITAGTIATARLGSGTASSSTFLRGDNTFAVAGESNTPYFNAKYTGASDNFSDGALYTINNYNSVVVDTCSGFATGTGRYTPDVAGYYYFEFQTHVTTPTVSNMKMVYGQLFKNGSGGSSYSERRIQQIDYRNNYGIGASVNVSGIFHMNGSSDYIYSAIVGDTNDGADARFAGESNYTWISGFLIAAT